MQYGTSTMSEIQAVLKLQLLDCSPRSMLWIMVSHQYVSQKEGRKWSWRGECGVMVREHEEQD